MSLLLFPLRQVSLDRHNRAVQSLRDGTMTVTLVKRTDAEIRALVKNGDSHAYSVLLTEHRPYCDCKDAFWRNVVCKHVVAVCVDCLQRDAHAENLIHLWFPDAAAPLCGEKMPRRFWMRWNYNAF